MKINENNNKEKVGCFEWKEAIGNLIFQDIKNNWYLENDTKMVDMLIEYCPFCGWEINEKGCTKNQ